MTRIFAQAVIAGCCAAGFAGTASAQLSFCNDTDVNASIAIGYLGGDQWTSEGWWNAGPGQCVTVVDAPQAQAFYYWHAVNENGAFASDDYYFCAVDDVFTIVGDTDCAARGHDRISFNEIQIGAAGTAEVRLTVALAPQPQAARKTPEPEPAPEPAPQKSAEPAAVALAEPEPIPAPAAEDAGTEAAPAVAPKPTLSLGADLPVAALLTSTPLDFPGIQAALIGDWTQADNADLTSRITRGRFEEMNSGTAQGRGRWRLAASCPGQAGEGVGIIATYDDASEAPVCMIVHALDDGALTLRDPADGTLVSYTK